jgi:hypothetical protein
MTNSYRDIRRAVASLAMLLTSVACMTGRPRAGCAQAVWELTPYQFHVCLAVQPTPELPPRVIDEMGMNLTDRVDGSVGAAWNLTVSEPEATLRRAMLADLENVGVDAIPKEILENDKVTLVTISPEVIGFRVAARELDVRTQTFSAVVEKDVFQGALLSDALFSAVVEAFAPLALIKTSEGEKVELRLRAGRLAPRDASLLAVHPGAIFRPVIRYDDREGKPKKILPLPWSYLAVEEVDESRLICQLYSGLHSALAGRRRGRVQELALAVKPPAKPTRLVIRARTGSNRPLGGYDVFLQKPGEKATEWLGRTDLAGSILIPPAPQLLHVIYIRNGGQLLAKLPLVPGVEESVEAAVIDDDQRLAAESVIMAAQEELVDLVTRRAVLAARISAAIKAGKADEADEFLVQLYGLRTRDQFTQQLDQERQKLMSEDPLIRRRVDLMFDKVRKLIVQYLDPNEVDKLGDQVRAAKEAAVSNRSG